MTFTGAIGTLCLFPLRAIIRVCTALGIHPNVLTLVGVLVNVAAAWALAVGKFMTAGALMIVANIFDFIDGKVAKELQMESKFGGFWDSTLDRFSDLALFTGLIWLYSTLGRHDYVLVTTLTLIFATMTSYTRARAESLIDKCKVGFMERPERIVLLMIGAFTNRMAGVLWVILALSVVTVIDRIYFTWRELNGSQRVEDTLTAEWNQQKARRQQRRVVKRLVTLPLLVIWRAVFWTYERATWQYDLMVVAILAFVWLTPPSWLTDPTASGGGAIAWILNLSR